MNPTTTDKRLDVVGTEGGKATVETTTTNRRGPVMNPFLESQLQRLAAQTLSPDRQMLLEAAEAVMRLRALESERAAPAAPTWTCAAKASTDPPQECNWPLCGCDPYADKVIAALQESGVLPDRAMKR